MVAWNRTRKLLVSSPDLVDILYALIYKVISLNIYEIENCLIYTRILSYYIGDPLFFQRELQKNVGFEVLTPVVMKSLASGI
jgi:hypothetical protein